MKTMVNINYGKESFDYVPNYMINNKDFNSLYRLTSQKLKNSIKKFYLNFNKNVS